MRPASIAKALDFPERINRSRFSTLVGKLGGHKDAVSEALEQLNPEKGKW